MVDIYNTDFPLLSSRAIGQVYKEKVFYIWRGKQRVRQYIIPPDPKSLPQLELRSKWAAGVKSWHDLSESDKLYWRRVGVRKKKPITSLNAFLSWWMRFGPWDPSTMGAVLKSIQRFTVIASGFQAITPVVTSKTVLICSFANFYQPISYKHIAYAWLWGPSNIYVGLVNAQAEIQLLEFHTGISPVQRGVINIPWNDMSADSSISAVDPERTIVINTGIRFLANTIPTIIPTIYLLNSTTLRAYRLGPSASINLYYEILEFQ